MFTKSTNLRQQGRVYEKIAANYLSTKGYKILFTNWTARWSEIDIIAQDNNNLVFVEVKFISNRFYDITKVINHKKIISQKRAINLFLNSSDGKQYKRNFNYRFDVIVFYKIYNSINLRHFQAVEL